MNDEQVEKYIEEKGLDAPRVTAAQIDAMMKQVWVHTHVVPNTTTTVATAILVPSGFTLGVAFSACVSKANFDEELGAKIATGKVEAIAKDKLWELEGYLLSATGESHA